MMIKVEDDYDDDPWKAFLASQDAQEVIWVSEWVIEWTLADFTDMTLVNEDAF